MSCPPFDHMLDWWDFHVITGCELHLYDAPTLFMRCRFLLERLHFLRTDSSKNRRWFFGFEGEKLTINWINKTFFNYDLFAKSPFRLRILNKLLTV